MATAKDKLIAAAQKLVEKGQYEKAIKEYLKVVQQDDKDVRIWLKIGDLYAKISKKTEAAETYQRVAQFYSDQGFYLKSVAVYKQILKIEPRLVEINQRLADLYKQLGLLSDAMQQYEAIAQFYQKEGNTKQALWALKQIVELDPENVAYRIRLAEMYSSEQMAREAIDEFTKAADQLKQSNRIDDFMKVAERLLYHSPDNRGIAKELAHFYIEKGDPRKALPKLQVCFKADPRDTEVLTLLAQAFEALDQRQKAVSVLKELVRLHQESGDQRARDEVYRRILVLAPGDPDAEAALDLGPRRPPPPVEEPPPPSPRGAQRAWQAEAQEQSHPSSDPSIPAPKNFDDLAAEDEDSQVRRNAWAAEALSPPTFSAPTSGGTQRRNAATPVPIAPEVSASDDDEIQKILNETDVYIKYNLHQKAVEHLQRVFERNPRHTEAREKIKALYLILGRKEEAILELFALAEQTEPGRARRYLREILDIDPRNVRAREILGEPLDFGGGDPSVDGSDPIDLNAIEELSADEFDVAEPSRRISGAESLALIGDASRFGEHEYEAPQEDDMIPLVVEQARQPEVEEEPAEIEDRFGFGDDGDGEAMAAQEDQTSSGYDDETGAGYQTADDGVGLADEPATASHPRPAPIDNPFGEYEESGELQAGDEDVHTRFDQGAQSGPTDLLGLGLGDEGDLPTSGGRPRPTPTPVPFDTASMEDELDEADFFVQQSLFDEARAILEALLARAPHHPLLVAKMRDLEAMEQQSRLEQTGEAIIEEDEQVAEMGAGSPEELPGEGTLEASMPPASNGGRPSPGFEVSGVKRVVEKGLAPEDYETHFDLGIAYKEMGLLDDAITEFKLVMKDERREVQCHLIIGMCFMEKQQHTDAIGHFKKGLYVEGISDRDAISLYFELGSAYETLGDPREALYYYEKVVKRDPSFREVHLRIEALRTGKKKPEGGGGAPPVEDFDAAFDNLMSEK